MRRVEGRAHTSLANAIQSTHVGDEAETGFLADVIICWIIGVARTSSLAGVHEY